MHRYPRTKLSYWAEELHKRMQIPKKDAMMIARIFLGQLENQLLEGKRITLPNIGSIWVGQYTLKNPVHYDHPIDIYSLKGTLTKEFKEKLKEIDFKLPKPIKK